jgi:hypothetical protein
MATVTFCFADQTRQMGGRARMWLLAKRMGPHPGRGRGRRGRVLAVAVAGVVALVAGACGGEVAPPPARPIQAGPTTTAGPGGTGAPPALAPGPLEPGTYATVRFRPKLSFRVGEGWGLLGDNENGIALAADFDPATGPDKQLSITAVKWVFDDPLLTDKELDANREAHIRPAPRDLVGWLRANRYLKVGPARPVTLGGIRGVQFDVAVKDIPGPSNCPSFGGRNHCVLLFPITRGNAEPIELVELGGVPSRYTVVEVKGQSVVVSVGAPPGQFEDFTAEADKVLKTVSFA